MLLPGCGWYCYEVWSYFRESSQRSWTDHKVRNKGSCLSLKWLNFTRYSRAVKHFSWETIISELQSKVPTLIKLLQCLVKKPNNNSKPFVTRASQLLKDNHPQLWFLQHTLSVHLYANGTSKNVSLVKCNYCINYN